MRIASARARCRRRRRGAVGNRADVAVQHVIELQPASRRRTARVVHHQVIELDRVLRVGEIALADDHRVTGRIAAHKQRALFLEIEAAGRAPRRAAGAFNLQHRPRCDARAVDRRPFGDQPEAVPRLARIVDGEPACHLVGAGGKMHRPTMGNRGVDRRLDRACVVMAAVADRAVTCHIDPRLPRTHQHRPAQCRRTGGGQRREVPRRLRQRRRHHQPASSGRH